MAIAGIVETVLRHTLTPTCAATGSGLELREEAAGDFAANRDEDEGCMKGRLTIIIPLCTLLLVAVPDAAGADGRGHGNEGYLEEPAAIPTAGLSADQAARIEACRASYLATVRPLQEKLLSKRVILRSLWQERNPDPGRIAAVQHEVSALREQLKESRCAYERGLRSILQSDRQQRLGRASAGSGQSVGSVTEPSSPQGGQSMPRVTSTPSAHLQPPRTTRTVSHPGGVVKAWWTSSPRTAAARR